LGHPQVSILLPVYNDSAYIDKALHSIFGQISPDFEVIVSDDASSDNSLDICRDWAKKDKRIRIIANAKNQGMTSNWNQALQEAKGDFVAKLDADDVMQPLFLETLLHDLNSNSEITMACCRTLSCNEALEPHASYLGDYAFVRHGLNPLMRRVQSGHDWYAMCFSDIQLWHSNAQMHRRANLLSLGGWDERWGCATDTDLILRILEQGNYVSHNPYCGIYYRHRENSVSGTFRKNKWLVFEGILIHLLSLGRYSKNRSKMPRILRREWWRFWQNWQNLKTDFECRLADFPEPLRSNLCTAASQLVAPSNRILLEGWLWEKGHNLKRSLFG
jgi:glycosyltransferase involved in cell wall biosynthesis